MSITKRQKRYVRKPKKLSERVLWYLRRLDKKVDRLTRILTDAGYEVRIKPYEICRDDLDVKILDIFMLRKQLKTSELCNELGLTYDSRNRMLVIGRIHSLSKRAKREIGEELIFREGYTHRAIWILNEKILETTQAREKKFFKETSGDEAREEASGSQELGV
jgi:hypothetical protein